MSPVKYAPGVVVVAGGSRIIDALGAAGGPTSLAYLNAEFGGHACPRPGLYSQARRNRKRPRLAAGINFPPPHCPSISDGSSTEPSFEYGDGTATRYLTGVGRPRPGNRRLSGTTRSVARVEICSMCAESVRRNSRFYSGWYGDVVDGRPRITMRREQMPSQQSKYGADPHLIASG